jgi:hypothetical protein
MRKQRTRQHFIENFGMNFKNMDVSYQEFEHALL